MKAIQSYVLIFLVSSLAACSSAPGDKDLQEAMTRALAGTTGAKMTESFKQDIAKMKVIGCSKTESGAYQCDVIGLFGAQSMRLVKSPDGWSVVQ